MEFINQVTEQYGSPGVSWIADHFIPTLEQVYGLISVLTVALALVGFGAAAAASGRRRMRSADLVCGWGVVSLVLTLTGVFTAVPFIQVTVALGFLSIPAIIFTAFRDDAILAVGTGKILVLTAPLILLAAAMAPSQWSEFSQWLLADRFLLDQDAFPRLSLPKSLADQPAHAYGVSLMTYLASRLAGFFTENAGPLFNILLLFSFSLTVMEIIRRAAGRAGDGIPGWGMAALGVLAVSLLNPSFTPKLVLTANTDMPAAVAAAFAGVAGWLMVEGLARGKAGQAWQSALQMGFILAALVNAEPAAPVLSVILVAAVYIAGLRDPQVEFWRLAVLLPLIAVPPAVIYGAWDLHVSVALPGAAHGVSLFEAWNTARIPAVAAGMLEVVFQRPLYFLLALTVIAFGVKAMFRFAGSLDRLAIIAAVAIGGYNAYLFHAYVTVSGGDGSSAAASYWRYSTHLGLLAVAFGAHGGALLWRHYLSGRLAALPSALAVGLVLALPLAFADKLRFDIVPPKQFVFSVGRELANVLPPDSRVMVIDPLETGFYAKMIGYLLYGKAQIAGSVSRFHGLDAGGIRRYVEKYQPTHIWLHTQNEAVKEAFGLRLDIRSAHLLAPAGQGWEAIRSWPYPGYTLPGDIWPAPDARER